MPNVPFSQFPGTIADFLGPSAGGQPEAQPMQRQPQPRQRRRRRKRRRQRQQQPQGPTVAEAFFNKLQTGAAVAGPGLIPFSVLPEQFRRNADLGEAPVGWDPRQLDDQERLLAANLVQQSDSVDEERRSMMMQSIMQAQRESDLRKRGI